MGLSQEDVAGLAGLGLATISRVEHRRHEPRSATRKRLALALCCTEAELWGDDA